MCGIAGVLDTKSIGVFEETINLISHRGPDDEGTFSDGLVWLGHRRLSILDLSANGHQPMRSADGRYVLVFNGEIYNHEEIRQTLVSKYTFRSSSDTETILYGYAEYGKSLFNKLNGIFALAIYDTHTHDLLIVRDQFGVKPLYYFHQSDRLYFASEIKAFSSLPDFDGTIKEEALLNYVQLLWSPGEQTPFRYVRKLLPGHYLEVNAQSVESIRITKYYELPFVGHYSTKSERELIAELDQKLLRAVERQLLSDVPVGFFLSGGLDSSAVVAMARRLHPDRSLPCYTIDTESDGNASEGFADDYPYAVLAAKHFNTDLRVVKAKSDIVRDFDFMVYHLDEPQADAAPLNVLNICRQARADGNVVLLGGTAGDDLLSGYRRHQALYYDRYLTHIPKLLKTSITQFLLRSDIRNPTLRRLRKLVGNPLQTNDERYADLFTWLPMETTHELMAPALRAQTDRYEPRQTLLDALNIIPQETSPLNRMLFWDLKYFLTDHNLNYTDKMSMAVGVEVRVPFLDKELVEFSTRIPPHLKMKGTTTKYLLRKAMEPYLPHEIIYRPKSGFGAPVRRWITHELHDLLEDYLSKESVERRGLFNYTAIQKLINDNKIGVIDASYSIWALLAIESWMRQFVDNPRHETNHPKS